MICDNVMQSGASIAKQNRACQVVVPPSHGCDEDCGCEGKYDDHAQQLACLELLGMEQTRRSIRRQCLADTCRRQVHEKTHNTSSPRCSEEDNISIDQDDRL